MSSDPFTLLAEGNGRLRATARRTLSEHTGGILLCVCLVLTAALPLVVLQLVNPFSEAFLLRTAYTVLTSTLCYLLFLPEGCRAEQARDPRCREVEGRLDALSALVRQGHLAAFSAFCRRTAERECSERAAELRARAAVGGRGSVRLLRRADRLRPLPISPTLILCEGGGGEASDVGRHRPTRGTGAALLRPFLVLGSSLLFSSVTILPGATPDAATAVRILSGLFGVTMAAFAGYTAGASRAQALLGRVERRILFLTSFCEEEGLAPPAKRT